MKEIKIINKFKMCEDGIYVNVNNEAMPIGYLMGMAKDRVPDGFKLCDGSKIPPEHKELISMIGTHFPDLTI